MKNNLVGRRVAVTMSLLALAACCSQPRAGDLLAAVEANDEAKALAALDAGADPNQRDAGGRPVLQLASGRGSERIVRELVRRGAELDATANDGTTALMAAAESCADAVVALLLQSSARKDLRDTQGRTAHDRVGSSGAGCTRARDLLR